MSDADQKQVILVVDNEDIIRHFLTALLKQLGTVEVAESGEEALQKVEAVNPDLIVLDINMPGMDGYEVCRRLKENEKTASRLSDLGLRNRLNH